ncbi:hypothetical protein EX30DRAFT_245152 [Ascodesmis nigricans]|uniref:Uncharacterized protein n=1 Tax=Ascodesmis nigricans TaxID=341454 RepID=A0A4S2MI26_9PEZI|nr:hypothetical protein EX30DRAFT_245152 [Ascodesmis nigricans]
MKFSTFTITAVAAMLSLASAAEDISCPAGQNKCGSGCVLGECCSQETALYCQPTEYCTTIDSILGCCPLGSTCTSQLQCSDFSSPRCTNGNTDPLCCTAELPFCDTASTTCVAQKPSTPAEESQSPATSSTPTAKPEENNNDVAEEEEEEEEEKQDECDAAPTTRTNTRTVTSTTKLPECTAPAEEDDEEQGECETYIYTKVQPISTVVESSTTPSVSPSKVVVPSKSVTHCGGCGGVECNWGVVGGG